MCGKEAAQISRRGDSVSGKFTLGVTVGLYVELIDGGK